MEEFTNASNYCQCLKSLGDQLKNVGAPITESRMVLQLVAGLTEAYNSVATLIRQKDPLPSFSQARSMLILEESGLAKKAATSTHSTLISSQPRHSDDPGSFSQFGGPHRGQNSGKKWQGKGKKKHGGSGGGRNSGGADPSSGGGRTGGGAGGGRTGGGYGSRLSSPHLGGVPPFSYGWSQQQGFTNPYSSWTMPPCPYPTMNWARPIFQPQGPMSPFQSGLLGPRPAQNNRSSQVYAASTSSVPTDIDSAMHTMSLHPPEANWVMDTGATNHMTSEQGTLKSYFNTSINNNGIIVGNDTKIPIKGVGHTRLSNPSPPFILKNVLHAPLIIKNLISVQKFTSDNSVSVEFDPFGFSVKDFRTGTLLMRCDSQGDLYLLTSAFSSLTTSSSSFAAISSSLWHDRLGHPGDPVFSFLRSRNFIPCNGSNGFRICHSCVLGKQIKLPFSDSNSFTVLPFDIIHCDLWTSPVLSSLGHWFYLVLLDDYSNFVWTFPLS